MDQEQKNSIPPAPAQEIPPPNFPQWEPRRPSVSSSEPTLEASAAKVSNSSSIFLKAVAAVLAVTAIVVSIGGGAMMYFKSAHSDVAVIPALPAIPVAPSMTAGTGIGSDIYANAINSVSNTIPGAPASSANPLEGAYVNPFN